MVEVALYVMSGLLGLGVVFLMAAAVRNRHATKRDEEKIEWVYDQIGRALDQIEEDDEDTIMAGLQILNALGEPDVQFDALPRLTELTKSPNPRIALYAREAISKLVRPLWGAGEPPPAPGAAPEVDEAGRTAHGWLQPSPPDDAEPETPGKD